MRTQTENKSETHSSLVERDIIDTITIDGHVTNMYLLTFLIHMTEATRDVLNDFVNQYSFRVSQGGNYFLRDRSRQ